MDKDQLTRHDDPTVAKDTVCHCHRLITNIVALTNTVSVTKQGLFTMAHRTADKLQATVNHGVPVDAMMCAACCVSPPPPFAGLTCTFTTAVSQT
jgi:hypothetical protein